MSRISRLVSSTAALADTPPADGLLQAADNVYLPESVSDSVAGLLPETGLDWVSPLPLVYRFDPGWRRDGYEATLRLATLVLTSEQCRQASLVPETPSREGRREPSLADRGEPLQSSRPKSARPASGWPHGDRPTN